MSFVKCLNGLRQEHPPLPLLLPTLPEHEFNHRLFRYHPNPAVVESLDAATPQELISFAPPDAQHFLQFIDGHDILVLAKHTVH